MHMRYIAILIIIFSYCSSSLADEAIVNPWVISKVEYFKEKSQFPEGDEIDRSAVQFNNGKRFVIPLERAKPISVLKGAEGTYFLLAQGADCTACDENTGLRFYKLDGLPLPKAKKRYTYPGRLYDYMDPNSLQHEARTFYGRCLNEPNDVVIWFYKYFGNDSKWHNASEVMRFPKKGDEIIDLNPKDASLKSVLSAANHDDCMELQGVDGTTEP